MMLRRSPLSVARVYTELRELTISVSVASCTCKYNSDWIDRSSGRSAPRPAQSGTLNACQRRPL
eukprot:1085732-Prymnesium_polylepis.2